MSGQQVTKAIILRRTNFGEADRILTIMSANFGKLSLIAKGARKSKSKLAGGIELFCVSQITFIRGRGEVGTLVSSRMEKNFSKIVTELPRTELGYEILKLVTKNTEDAVEAAYYELLERSLAELDNQTIPLALVRIFFQASLIKLAGHAPNLSNDASGEALDAKNRYNFSADGGFISSASGNYGASEIKFLRLVFGGNAPKVLARITDSEALASSSQPLLTAMLRHYLRV